MVAEQSRDPSSISDIAHTQALKREGFMDVSGCASY